MWYLYAMIAIYLMLPFYKIISRNAEKNDILYLLAVQTVFMSIIPLISSVSGKNIPFYGILFVVGFAVAVLTAIPKARRMKMPWTEIACSGVFAGVFGILGAKVLSILTSLDLIIRYRIPFLEFIQNGFVFYGGLIGGALGLLLYAKIYHEPVLKYFDLFAAGTALGHAFGRVGCLFSGCCYGIPTTGGFYVLYHRAIDPNTPLEVRLLPIQFIECMCLVAVFLAAEIAFYASKKRGLSSAVYALTYATVRFTLEFFRGDLIRGVWGGLSTSQYISLAVVAVCLATVVCCAVRRRRKKDKPTV